MLRVEMLSTGDEVLHGQIIDTNAAWLADYLFQQGVPLSSRSTVGDDLDALVGILDERSKVADVLIVNGGLGPTSDDLSALAAATAAGERLIEHPEWIARMEAFFAERGRAMSPTNRKQAQIPSSADMLDNPVGTACGFAMRLNRCLMFFTPGVPSEFKVMVEQQIVPRLRQRFSLGEPPLCLRLTTFGRAESDLAAQLDPLLLPPGCVIGYRSSMPIIELKLTGPASQRDAMALAWQRVREVAGESMVFEGTEGLPVQLGKILRQRNLRLALSEQFTAGLLSWQLQGAEVPLAYGELPIAANAESFDAVIARAQRLAMESGADLALVVGALENSEFTLALQTPAGVSALTSRFNVNRHSLRTRQEVVAMLAMNMLRRWLNGWPICAQHGWIEVVKSVG